MKHLLGAVTAAALLGFAGGAYAQNDQDMQQQPQQKGQTQQKSAQAEPVHSLTGTVLKADRNTVIIEFNNAAVPFQVQRDTQFKGVTSAKSLKEGQEVRASYNLVNDRNVLRSLEFMSQPAQPGTGGAGETEEDKAQKPDEKSGGGY